MKKTSLILALALPIVFLSCNPDDPKPKMAFNLHADLVIHPPESKAGDPTLDLLDSPGCPTAGDNCVGPIPVYHPPIHENVVHDALLASLLSYYNNNNVPGFFETQNWMDLLPAFEYDEGAYANLVSGTYKIYIYPDNTLIVYKNGSITPANVLYTFKL